MKKDMTNGSPWKLIIAFGIPLVIGNIFQQFYNMVDSIIVGKYVGKVALAAVGSTGSLNFMIIGFGIGISHSPEFWWQKNQTNERIYYQCILSLYNHHNCHDNCDSIIVT